MRALRIYVCMLYLHEANDTETLAAAESHSRARQHFIKDFLTVKKKPEGKYRKPVARVV
jgi:hypothetical protein